MPNKVSLVKVMCPYFQYDTDRQIVCEGFTTGNKLNMKFDNRILLSDYQVRYCYRYPNDCPIAKALDEKYRE